LGDPNNRPSELTSWKEVADYLNVNVRTAQKWEKTRGLPVKRSAGSRGRVVAFPGELDAWKAASVNGAKPWAEVRFLQRYAAVTTVLLVALLGIHIAEFLKGRGTGPPALYRAVQDTLVVMDADGRELWRKSFGHPLSERFFPSDQQRKYPPVKFADLDGDGKIETLVVDQEAGAGQSTTPLVCFSDRGRERWRFIPGKPVATRKENFPPSGAFLIEYFAFVSMEDRQQAIVLESRIEGQYPTQIALLSPRGYLIREYWHSGGFAGMVIEDLDKDGAEEIYLAGVSNGYKQATLLVLDPRRFAGASLEENADYQLLGFPLPVECARLLFPRTCINRKFEPYNYVLRISKGETLLTVQVFEASRDGVSYHADYFLGPGPVLDHVDYTDGLRSLHATLFASGQIDHPLSPEEEAELRNIRFLTPTHAETESSVTSNPNGSK
jgi:hypothetical protein